MLPWQSVLPVNQLLSLKRKLPFIADVVCDDESSDDDVDVKLPDRKRIAIFYGLISILSFEGAEYLGPGFCLRKGNAKRDRSAIIRWSQEIDDVMFSRQFRLHREDFFYVLLKITSALRKNFQQACNSSGSPIPPYLMLLITLRILAGASYLDMIHYHVHIDSVSKIVWTTVCAISKKLNNIQIAESEQDCLKLAKDWSVIQKQRWGTYLSAGTIYAGDGLVIEILQPSAADLKGRAITIFRNRKNSWGLIAQGFCDAHTRFSVFDIKWPGGTNDIVAYRMTELCAKAESGFFPAWATFVLDEDYSSCGGFSKIEKKCFL